MRLKLSDVDHQAGQRLAGGLRRLPLARDVIHREAAVGQSGQWIGPGELLQPPVRHRQFRRIVPDLLAIALDLLLQRDQAARHAQVGVEDLQADRQREEFVGAGLQGREQLLLALAGREHENVSGAPDARFAQGLADLRTAAVVVGPVDDDELRQLADRELQRVVGGVGEMELDAGLVQRLRQLAAQCAVGADRHHPQQLRRRRRGQVHGRKVRRREFGAGSAAPRQRRGLDGEDLRPAGPRIGHQVPYGEHVVGSEAVLRRRPVGGGGIQYRQVAGRGGARHRPRHAQQVGELAHPGGGSRVECRIGVGRGGRLAQGLGNAPFLEQIQAEFAMIGRVALLFLPGELGPVLRAGHESAVVIGVQRGQRQHADAVQQAEREHLGRGADARLYGAVLHRQRGDDAADPKVRVVESPAMPGLVRGDDRQAQREAAGRRHAVDGDGLRHRDHRPMAVMRGAVGRGDDPPGERRVGHDDLGDLARGHVLALDEAHQVQRHALGRGQAAGGVQGLKGRTVHEQWILGGRRASSGGSAACGSPRAGFIGRAGH